MPALTTGTSVGGSNASMGWNNTTWGQVDPPNWPSPTSSWGVDQSQGDRWASSTSPQMEYVHGLGWGQILSVCFDLISVFETSVLIFSLARSCRLPTSPSYNHG
jgi:hypothetical protein